MGIRKTLLILSLLIVASGFYVSGQYWKKDRNGAQPVSRRPRNIYILTASGLRPDHLNCYLYQHGQTPAIDFLAYDGIRFNNAYSPSPDSLLAHLSLLTGHYPFSQPLRDTIDFLELFRSDMPGKLQTLPGWLAERKYRTAAFLSDPELRYPSFFQGLFSEVYEGDPLLPVWQSAYTPAQLSVLARDWVSRNSSAPQLLLLNFGEPTVPFSPPPPFAAQYEHHPYDGEIAALDEQIGLFIHRLKQLGLFDNSILIFTSPYGESLNQNVRTGNLSTENLRVPLFIAAPGILPRHQEYNQTVSLVDLVPTIRALLDQTADPSLDGLPLFKKGTSEEITRETVLGQSNAQKLFGLPSRYFITNGKSGWVWGDDENGTPVLKQAMAVALQKARVIPEPTTSSSALEFDPNALLEAGFILARKGHPDRAIDLIDSFQQPDHPTAPLMAWKAALLPGIDSTRAKKLYAEAYRASANPLLLLPLSRLHLQNNDYPAALAAARKSQRFFQRSYSDYSITGIILFDLKRYKEALPELDCAVKANPYEAREYLYRGMTFARMRAPQKAEADLKKAIELDPSGIEAYRELGLLFQSANRPADAIPYFRKFIDRNPKDYSAMLELARLQRSSGNNRAARQLCEQVLVYATDPRLKQQARQMIAAL